ncbi:MAG TPA: transglycosylase SLT domain-containing protein [Holophaga sp.]|nr:transglycosylase SLT domain-containing protein [Holophaga sp.]
MLRPRTWMSLALIGAATVPVLLYAAQRHHKRAAHAAPDARSARSHPASGQAQVSTRNAARNPAPLPDWCLKGGLISGGGLTAQARGEWPAWMQLLLCETPPTNLPTISAEALADADLYKIPDVYLNQAIARLADKGVFTPRILRQACAIGYTARAEGWVPARTAYQVAYLAHRPLPVEDPITTSRLLTELALNSEQAVVRQALERTPYPASASERAAYLRALEPAKAAAKDRALDRSRPVWERLSALTSLRDPADAKTLVASFRQTDGLDRAVFHALTREWIDLSDPLVDEAMAMRKAVDERAPWFLVRPQERVSDLLWERASDALAQGRDDEAMRLARRLLERYPSSSLSDCAARLIASLDPRAARPNAVLRVPGDVTWFNADRLIEILSAGPVDAWPEPFQASAQRGRFDLILAAVDPERDPATFLRAAHLAGQQDLVTRFLACERIASPSLAAYLYPTALADLADRLLREEGLEGQVDAAFVLAMVKNESVFQPTARSGADAFGIMQLLKPTFRAMAGRNADILDPETNIRAGIRYYRRIIRSAQLEQLPMEARLCYVLAGYHAGEGRAKRWRTATEEALQGRTSARAMILRIEAIPITSTRQYVAHGMGDWQIFRRKLGR